MGNGRHIGRWALTSARQIRHLDYAATRIAVLMGAVVPVVTATVLLAPASTVSPAVKLSADSTALILGRTSVPTPNDAYVEIVKNQYIGPTHPRQNINYIAVTTPQEFWPLATLLFRIPGLVLGPREIWGPGGPGWPDEPWWKLSGLFDLTVDQSLYAGVADLEEAMAQYGNDNLVIYGYQQGAAVANVEKRKLAEQYPVGTKAPDIDFVLGGDPNLPNGGFASRFSGLYIPILDLLYNGPASTDTQFDTTVIVRQYDFEDFPLYPLNIVADLNALLGAPYVNFNGFDVSLAPDPSTSPSIQSKHGDTAYYFFPTTDLPLFGPLRSLGVPESVIDVFEPVFRVLVELGYDRSIPLWEPTPARLLPALDPGKVASDLVNAIGEGINNARALVGALLPRLSISGSPSEAAATKHDGLDPYQRSLDLPHEPTVSASPTLTREEWLDAPDGLIDGQEADIGAEETDVVIPAKDPSTETLNVELTDEQDEAEVQNISVPGNTVRNGSRDIGDGVSQVSTAGGSRLPEGPAPTRGSSEHRQRKVAQQRAATRDQVNRTTGAVKSVEGRNAVATENHNEGSSTAQSSPERKTPVRDAGKEAHNEIPKGVATVPDSVKKTLSGGKTDHDNGDGDTGGKPSPS